jgi:hypothetical protein
MFPQHDLQSLTDIFEIKTKKELEAHCKDLVIHADDFANLVLAVELGAAAPYQHQLLSSIAEPEHLQPTEADFAALGEAKAGESLTGRAAKFSTRVRQLFKDRRFLVGHLFHTPDYEFWQFFYFDQRDMAEFDNHWVGGSHVHLLSDLWPNLSAKAVVETFMSGKPRLPTSLHVRFDNRDPRAGGGPI